MKSSSILLVVGPFVGSALYSELPAEGGDGAELESADRSFLSAHHLGSLAGRKAGEEAQGDGFSLVVGQRRKRGVDSIEVLPDHRHVLGSRFAGAVEGHRIQVGVFVTCPSEIYDRIPGQPKEPAPEGNAPRLISRKRFQGLYEDKLRQVLRVRRAVDAADNVAVDRQVEMIK
jgi:hypothetical protein